MTNRDRAGYGLAALEHGTPDYSQNDGQTNVVDTLANIMHYCDTDDDLSFEEALLSARGHYSVEFNEEGGG